ncbi:6-phosphofructo-2-kinase/fructose-2,6-bisphosphatase [Anabrus simplex]|uniref:6-phosphofructo-2-kinase/fructose-2, 6-bisphosphatase n=1 Tax=Anabrus simplex TaxID=316456 RepID=UPI0035A2900B
MRAAWFLKEVSSSIWSNLTSVWNCLLIGTFIGFFTSSFHLSCTSRHLCVKVTSRFNSVPKPWCYIFFWIFGEKQGGEMVPTIAGMCGQHKSKDGEELCEKPKRTSTINKRCRTKQLAPLVIALVGLPARSKTVIAHKLTRYLNWIGEVAEVFTVSDYRRKLMERYDNHNLFRADNHEAMEIRSKSAELAMSDAEDWLKGSGNVVVIDGTHIGRSHRRKVHDHFVEHLGCKLLFVEVICDDDDILSRNIKDVLTNSPDYKDMNAEKALDDFHHKIQHYLEQYETINPKQEGYSVIKIIDDGESISTHNVTGYIEGKVLTFLSNFKPSPKTLYFSRHGESEYNVLGRIGGDTDLSPRGRLYGLSLARHINDAAIPDLEVWTSQLRRTKQTAANINAPTEHLAALNELDAGVCEGLSYEEMQEKFPQEFAWRDQDKLRYRYPWGESYVDIMTRIEPVLLDLEHENNVLVISHQAILRCILGYFLNKQPEELPYLNVPLHTIIKLTSDGYSCNVEYTKLPVDCVDTYRKQPKNCSTSRSQDDALLTVPFHFDSLNLWSVKDHSELIEQH